MTNFEIILKRSVSKELKKQSKMKISRNGMTTSNGKLMLEHSKS